MRMICNIFNTVAKSLELSISVSKRKCITISKTPLRCKLVMDNRIIHQEKKFLYLGIEISSFGDLKSEVRGLLKH